MSSLRLGADGRLFRGRYRLIRPATLIDERSRCGFGLSVQVKSPCRARAWYPCRREHSLLCRRNDGSDSPRLWLKIVRTAASYPGGANLPIPAALRMDLAKSHPDRFRRILPISASGDALRVHP